MKARTFAGTSMLNASAVAMSSADGWILKHATRNFFVPSMLVARSSDVIGGASLPPVPGAPGLPPPVPAAELRAPAAPAPAARQKKFINPPPPGPHARHARPGAAPPVLTSPPPCP